MLNYYNIIILYSINTISVITVNNIMIIVNAGILQNISRQQLQKCQFDLNLQYCHCSVGDANSSVLLSYWLEGGKY